MFTKVKDWFLCRALHASVKHYTEQPVAYTLQQHIDAGLFNVQTFTKTFTDTDGIEYTIIIPRAAETDMWPMGTHLWIRDAAIGADRVLRIAALQNNAERTQEGKDLLLSVLTVLSTQAQLQTMYTAISVGTYEHGLNPKHWPQIFLNLDVNLVAAEYEPWTHKQDAWQMTAVFTFKALRRGWLQPNELTKQQRQFLMYSALFLVAVEYWRQPNSGSWEELEAVRSSVLTWDTTLLQEYILALNEYDWLQLGAKEVLQECGIQIASVSAYCVSALHKGLEVLAKQLPYESPNYSKDDPRYREADAALMYVLHNNSVEQIAQYLSKDSAWAKQLESAVLQSVLSLYDERTQAIARYNNDSYQRNGFFRPSIVKVLRRYYGSQSGEASGVEDFTQRNQLVPNGREAMWTHFVWQLSSWYAERYIATGTAGDLEQSKLWFERGCNLITYAEAPTLTVTSTGKVHRSTVPAHRLPECYITDTSGNADFVFASPHTPLNWSTREAELAHALQEYCNLHS